MNLKKGIIKSNSNNGYFHNKREQIYIYRIIASHKYNKIGF